MKQDIFLHVTATCVETQNVSVVQKVPSGSGLLPQQPRQLLWFHHHRAVFPVLGHVNRVT